MRKVFGIYEDAQQNGIINKCLALSNDVCDMCVADAKKKHVSPNYWTMDPLCDIANSFLPLPNSSR